MSKKSFKKIYKKNMEITTVLWYSESILNQSKGGASR
jgi:hypothetical protein